MPDNAHPTVAELRRLEPFREMAYPDLQQLAEKLQVNETPGGTQLLRQGSTDSELFFLLEGTIRLRADDGATEEISHTDKSARSPIARLRPCHYDVQSMTRVRYLVVDDDFVSEQENSQHGDSILIEESELGDESEPSEVNELTLRIYEDLNSNRLLLPSLPDTAVRIGQAVNSIHSDAKKVAVVVETDPAMSTKLLKAANSPRFAGLVSVETLPTAIARLGLRTTHNLVITFALRELFRSHSPLLNKQMAELWAHSQQIAAICHVMASQLRGFDPEEALLAGLIHDIGELAVISYSQHYPSIAGDPEQLQASIRALRAQLGTLILNRWKLPGALSSVPEVADQWMRDHAGKADYGDLVILAHAHAHAEEHGDNAFPGLSAIPAYRKVNPGPATDENRLAMLMAAEREMEESLELLAS